MQRTRFLCPNCRRVYSAPASAIGRTARCEPCGISFRIEAAPAGAPLSPVVRSATLEPQVTEALDVPRPGLGHCAQYLLRGAPKLASLACAAATIGVLVSRFSSLSTFSCVLGSSFIPALVILFASALACGGVAHAVASPSERAQSGLSRSIAVGATTAGAGILVAGVFLFPSSDRSALERAVHSAQPAAVRDYLEMFHADELERAARAKSSTFEQMDIALNEHSRWFTDDAHRRDRDDLWWNLLSAGSLDELRRYAGQFADGRHVAECDDLFWSLASRSRESLLIYGTVFPGGRHTVEVPDALWSLVDSHDSLTAFLAQYPDGMGRADADDVCWRVAKKSDPAQMEDYATRLPRGKHTDACEHSFSSLVCQARSTDLTFLIGARYLKAFPSGPGLADVDNALWGQCHSLAQIDEYLRLLPQGRHATDVDDKSWNLIGSTDDIEAYQRRFPNGKHLAEVDARRTQLAFAHAGQAGQLPQSDRVEGSGKTGVSVYYLDNDTGKELTIRFMGPETFSLTFAPGERAGIELRDGTYEEMAEVLDRDVRPYKGRESFGSGKYVVTFYISQGIAPPRVQFGGVSVDGWPIKRRAQ